MPWWQIQTKIRAAGLPSLRPWCHIWGVLPQDGDKGWADWLPHRECFIPISPRWCCSWIQRGSGASQIYTWPHGNRGAVQRVLVHLKDIWPPFHSLNKYRKMWLLSQNWKRVTAEPFPFLTHLLIQDLNKQWRWNQACLHVCCSRHLLTLEIRLILPCTNELSQAQISLGMLPVFPQMRERKPRVWGLNQQLRNTAERGHSSWPSYILHWGLGRKIQCLQRPTLTRNKEGMTSQVSFWQLLIEKT